MFTFSFAFVLCAIGMTFTVGAAFGVFALAFFQGASRTDLYE